MIEEPYSVYPSKFIYSTILFISMTEREFEPRKWVS